MHVRCIKWKIVSFCLLFLLLLLLLMYLFRSDKTMCALALVSCA